MPACGSVGHDVYLNVAGGLKITEPAADLAAAAALVSSLTGALLPADTVYFGEIGLSGAIRPVTQAAARLKEANKLGFVKAVVPADTPATGRIQPVGHIAALVADIAASGNRIERPDRVERPTTPSRDGGRNGKR